MKYKEALSKPAVDGKGWSKATGLPLQAAYAQALATQHCLSPEKVYNWANAHNVNLKDERKRLQTPDLLLVAVLNDWTLDQVEKKIK